MVHVIVFLFLANFFTRHTLVWKGVSVAVLFSVQLQAIGVKFCTCRSRTDLLPFWRRYPRPPRIPKYEIKWPKVWQFHREYL